ncbi:ribonuclease HII [Jiella sp. MQZ9-1]|uniref:Ribonuclease HII n=1 Tax=Jiella flava TaxID=2816857 RepID=A0A939FWS1_9HYPH|nr:ribonuclease HII [Jiella flava]MBO0661661.1 ribonuclease HII [Jiella flava]MCD2470303.1 ribonuclease HII [Jiella flava]
MTAHSSDSPFSPPGTAKAEKSAKPSRAKRAGPDFNRERQLIANGRRRVAGVDEAGRGPLAGPVTAAAVILDPDDIPDGLDDSKALKASRREALFAEILAKAWVAVSFASPAEIDRLNIRGATLLAMRRAVAALETTPDHALIDGRDVPPGLVCEAAAVIGGDAASQSIAAASIVAKVLRDRLMRRACLAFPGYGFSQHMGYGTAAHLEAIARLGPSPLHRMSFSPLKQALLPLPAQSGERQRRRHSSR